jgi:hypothetical protein
LNGGTYNDSSTYTTERLGLESINAPTPTRDGYVLTGWKITSSEGKQSGKIYTPEQLSSMLKDGNYWSSLFYNATFEALWERLDNTAPTIELNSVSWDTSTSTLKIDAKANDSGYGIMSFVLKDNGIDYSQ